MTTPTQEELERLSTKELLKLLAKTNDEITQLRSLARLIINIRSAKMAEIHNPGHGA